jgi:uncharacterized protein (TIGR03067 family)
MSGRAGRRWALLVPAGLALLVAGGAVWYFALREKPPANDLERFQGEWKFATPGRPDVTFVRVEADRWQYVSNGVETQAFRLTLDEAASPRRIDLELIDTKGLRGPVPRLHGVYEFDGDRTVRVRLAPGVEERPTALDDPDEVRVMTKGKIDTGPRE